MNGKVYRGSVYFSVTKAASHWVDEGEVLDGPDGKLVRCHGCYYSLDATGANSIGPWWQTRAEAMEHCRRMIIRRIGEQQAVADQIADDIAALTMVAGSPEAKEVA